MACFFAAFLRGLRGCFDATACPGPLRVALPGWVKLGGCSSGPWQASSAHSAGGRGRGKPPFSVAAKTWATPSGSWPVNCAETRKASVLPSLVMPPRLSGEVVALPPYSPSPSVTSWTDPSCHS